MTLGFGFGLPRRRFAGGWSPSALFTFGEQGAWYDPSDLTTLFQDAAGTTPVTAVEQPVGLMLDKSRGLVLGPELVTNGDFATDTWWTKGSGCTIAGGLGVATAAPNGSGWYRLNFLTIGRYYETTFTVVSCSAGGFRIRYFGTNTSATYSIPGTYTARILADTTGFVIETVGTTTGTIDNVSVKEVTGNHASQTTAGSRPLLSARYNLLTQTENFSNAAWTGLYLTITENAGAAPNGTNTADLLTCNAENSPYRTQTFSALANTKYTFSLRVKASNHNFVALNISDGATFNYYVSWNLSTQALLRKDTQLTDEAISSLGDGWYSLKCSYTFATAAANANVGVFLVASNGLKQAISVNQAIFVWGADLRVANEPAALPAYQRVTTSTDYDTVNFPPYLRFDGSDDSLATASIDFSAGPTNPPVGPQLVTNGDFAVDLSGWPTNVGATWATDGALLTAATASAQLAQGFSTVAGRLYKLDYQFVSGNTGNSILRVGTSANDASILNLGMSAGAGSFSRYFFATGATTWVTLFVNYPGVSITGKWDGISVREVDAAYAPDKMTVFGGYRRLTDAGPLILVELSASAVTNAGSFAWVVPDSAVARGSYNLNGTLLTAQTDSLTASAPSTLVATTQYDIAQSTSAQEIVVRLNGTAAATATAGNGNAGTGTFGNYPLFIGRRNNATLPFSGRLFSLIVRGAATSAADINSAEGYVETKTFGKDMSIQYFEEVQTATGDAVTTATGDSVFVYQQYV